MEFTRRAVLATPILSALPAGALAAEAASPRLVQRLRDWRFHLGHGADPEHDFGWGRDQRTYAKMGVAADGARQDFDDSRWEAVQVPHDWAVALPFAKPAAPAPKEREDAAAAHGFKAIGREWPGNSVGWYRARLDIAPTDRNRAVWLEFDGVFRDCTVFVNGYVAGGSESGYAPFQVPVGDFLDYDGGPNVVAVRVDASLGEGWFYEGAGLYRHVDLVRAGPVHVPQWGSVVRTCDDGTASIVRAEVEVRNAAASPTTAELRHRLLDPDGREVAVLPPARLALTPGATATARGEARVPAPRRWSPDAPALYRLVSEVTVAGAVVDRYETPFGIRNVRFDAQRGFLLDGRPVKLLGTCNHQDHAGVGTGIPDALHAWRIDRVKEMGSNAWRTAHNPAAAAFLDLADEKGLLVIAEARRNSTDATAMGELERMIRRDRNRPSVIAWSLGNEEPHQGTARGARVTAAMQARVRELDPTRPTTFALDNSWDKGVGRVVDAVGFNYRTDKIAAFHAAHPDVPVYGSETGSTVATRGAYANDTGAQVVRAYDTEHPWWASTAEAWWTVAAANPYIAGGFVWTGFDYRGEPTPFPRFPSISSYFGVMDSCGFPKDNYYYYRAWWRPDRPLVHLLPHWNWPGREGQPVEVWVHGNCAEVELLLNGRSLGRKAMPRNRHLSWQVPYAPGRLEARGYDDGRRSATDVRETAARPVRVILTADRRILMGGRGDAAVLRAELVDARGRPVPDDDRLVRFTVAGDAEVIGVGNGNPTSLEADRASERRTFHGLAQAIVRLGGRPGMVTIQAEADGLAPGRAAVTAAPS